MCQYCWTCGGMSGYDLSLRVGNLNEWILQTGFTIYNGLIWPKWKPSASDLDQVGFQRLYICNYLRFVIMLALQSFAASSQIEQKLKRLCFILIFSSVFSSLPHYFGRVSERGRAPLIVWQKCSIIISKCSLYSNIS